MKAQNEKHAQANVTEKEASLLLALWTLPEGQDNDAVTRDALLDKLQVSVRSFNSVANNLLKKELIKRDEEQDAYVFLLTEAGVEVVGVLTDEEVEESEPFTYSDPEMQARKEALDAKAKEILTTPTEKILAEKAGIYAGGEEICCLCESMLSEDRGLIEIEDEGEMEACADCIRQLEEDEASAQAQVEASDAELDEEFFVSDEVASIEEKEVAESTEDAAAFEDAISVQVAEAPKKERATKAQAKAGCKAIDAFHAFLFCASMTLDEMTERWAELSGDKNKKTTFSTYLGDIKKGIYVQKRFKGQTIEVQRDAKGRYSAKAEGPYVDCLQTLDVDSILGQYKDRKDS